MTGIVKLDRLETYARTALDYFYSNLYSVPTDMCSYSNLDTVPTDTLNMQH